MIAVNKPAANKPSLSFWQIWHMSFGFLGIQFGWNLDREYCFVCHGMSDGVKTATAKGMFPSPPKLLSGKGVTDDPVGETYWKVANGIRLTGMPSYRESLTEQQMWQISQLLATGKLPATVRDYLAQPSPTK